MNRKHHCRSCGQIFVSEVCKKTAPIPSQGHETPVRVCDICHDQLERGDPVCIAKNVALMREDGEMARHQGAKALADWASMDPQFAHRGNVEAIDAFKVPELLHALLHHGSAPTQASAARLLAGMLAHDEYREMVLQAEARPRAEPRIRGPHPWHAERSAQRA